MPMKDGLERHAPSNDRNMKRTLILLFFSLLFLFKAEAQEDPVLAGQILLWTEKAQSELRRQEDALALETAGLIWMEDEWKKTADVQRIYNDYLDSFRDVIVYAGQAYGFYLETEKLIKHFDSLGRVIDAHPDGIFAGALSARRNQIYVDVLKNALDIINDISIVCLSDTKMTEQQRVDMVFAIRPKLVRMNRQITRLIRVVKYSSYTDILIEIELEQRKNTDKSAITRAALARWKNNAGMR